MGKGLTAPALWNWLTRLAGEWSLIAATFWGMAAVDHPVAYVVGVLLVGTRQHALTLLGHDAAHFAVSRHRRVNDLLGSVFCFWPHGLGLNSYRRFHFAHHAHEGTAGDPELDLKAKVPHKWSVTMSRPRRLWILLSDLVFAGVWETVQLVAAMPPVRRSDWLGPAVLWLVILTGLGLSGSLWMAGIWVVALVTSFRAVFRARAWSEHLGIVGTHRIGASWWERALYLPHNTWCHWEHHRRPGVPCSRLPALRARGDSAVPVIRAREVFTGEAEIQEPGNAHSPGRDAALL